MSWIKALHRLFTFSAMLSFLAALLPGCCVAQGTPVTMGYWRFENAPGYTNDSGANGLTLSTQGTIAPIPSVLPVSGAGALFPKVVGGATNAQTASFSGGYFRRLPNPLFHPATFTVEALIHQVSRGSTSASIVSRWQFATDANDRAWNLAVAGTSPPAGRHTGELMLSLSADGVTTTVVGSGIILETGKDYFVAATFAPGVTTFRVRDLASDAMVTTTRPHSVSSVYNAAANLLMGSYSNGMHLWNGLIDEVRFSSGVRTDTELLVGGTATAPAVVLTGQPSAWGGGSVSFEIPGPGYTLRYTVDGSDPTETSSSYTTPIPITGPTTLKARIFAEGMLPGFLFSQSFNVASYELLGKIRPRHARNISGSTWSVGGETLDRDFAVYSKYKDWLGPLGVKSVRLQTGWARTEKVKGVYDWAWLDEPVYDAISQGVRPWMNVSYGNTIYPGGGEPKLGGTAPTSAEAKAAWDAWVLAMATRYKDVIREWEIWNEPERYISAAAYTDLYIRSAEAIRSVQPDAHLIAIAFAGINLDYAEDFLTALAAQGKLGLVNEVCYHAYAQNPESHYGTVQSLRNRIASVPGTSHIRIRQGENGAPSQLGGFGALSGYAWTEKTQAKWDLRRMLGDLGRDIPSNVFTLMELQYTTGLNSKGLLKRNADYSVAYAKPAYYAVRNVTALFDDRVQRITSFPVTQNGGSNISIFGYRRTDINKPLVTIWKGNNTPSDDDVITEVDLTVPFTTFSEPVLADLRSGVVRKLPAGSWTVNATTTTFTDLPITDSPVVLADISAVFSPYDRWVMSRFIGDDIINLAVSGEMADPDQDGITNLLAFATAREIGDRGSPVKIIPKGDRHALYFRYRGAAAVDYIVEGSTNLVDWNPVARLPKGGIWQLEEGASVLGASLGEGINEVQVSDTDAGAAEDKRFLRLRVE